MTDGSNSTLEKPVVEIEPEPKTTPRQRSPESGPSDAFVTWMSWAVSEKSLFVPALSWPRLAWMDARFDRIAPLVNS